MSFASFFRHSGIQSQDSSVEARPGTDIETEETIMSDVLSNSDDDADIILEEAASELAPANIDDRTKAQALLRQQILSIQNDSSTTEIQKAILMQTLMTRDYVSLAYAQPSMAIQEIGHPLSALDQAKTYFDEDSEILGCPHYQRNCKLQCSTCHAWATCRFCHNEAHQDHELIRTATKNMLCMFCRTIQPASQTCINPDCLKRMALYYCNKCKLWDNDQEKHIYHCADCGICRVGRGIGKDFFHCDRCNVCMDISLKGSHRCIEHSTECDCPICGEYMFNSTATVVFMNCGHSIHQKCFYEYVKNNYKCPTCSKSLRNMDSLFRQLHDQIEGEPMPPPYDTWQARILCNDCSSKSTTKYHFVGNRCLNCQSYNTVELDIIRTTT